MLKDRVQGTGIRVKGCRGILQNALLEKPLIPPFTKVADPYRGGLRGIFVFISILFLFNAGLLHASIGNGQSHGKANNALSTGNDAVINQIMKNIHPATDQNMTASVDPVTDEPYTGTENSENINNINSDTEDSSLLDDESEVGSSGVSAMSGGVVTGPAVEPAPSYFVTRPIEVSPAGNSGAAATSIPIVVPPGRNGIQPNLSLNYNSSSKNGWLGVGWSLDMGAVQRNTKKGVNYSVDDFVVIVNGSASELVLRNDWGTDYFGAKLEGAFTKYHYIRSENRWEAIARDGTVYKYGTYADASSRQDDPSDASHVFNWFLDKVEDTNGNYMTISYVKDAANGQTYPDRIDYTGKTSGSAPTNYVQFYWEVRTDLQPVYTAHFMVKTVKRLITIKVVSKVNGQDQVVRAYKLEYDGDIDTAGSQYSVNTGRSLLGSVQMFGHDATFDGSGYVTGGGFIACCDVWMEKRGKGF